MPRFLLPILMVALAAPAAEAAGAPAAAAPRGNASPPADLRTFVDAIQARYNRIRDFRARFVQESRVQAAAVAEKSGGEVFFQRPGKMRWNYKTPQPQEIVINGGKLWQYVPADRQVVIQGFDAARVEYTFLTGVGTLDRDFRMAWARPDRRPGDPLRYVELVPRDEQAAFSRVVLGVEPKRHRVLVTEVVDLFGNMTAIRFNELRDNTGLGAGLFVFRIPKGVDVIDMTAAAGGGR